MHPELFTVPFLNTTIKTYGAFLCVGFLTAVWLAMRRARRLKANPDTVLDLSFLALVFGVGGARLFYVVHYWSPQFSSAPNPILAAVNITEGGLEFLGGFVGAVMAVLIYARWKGISLRLYLDLLAPSCMWGLAFGRLGCFFNGCCFGGVCLVPGTQQASVPWAVRFPFASSAQWKEWEDREVTVPAELIVTSQDALQPWLLPGSLLSMSVEQREGPTRQYEQLRKRYDEAKETGADAKVIAELQTAMEAALKQKRTADVKLASLRRAQKLPSRIVPTRKTSVSELEELASQYRSLPVHPTQLYSAIHAMLLFAFLSMLLYARRRHGVVFAALLILYPIARVLLELIRSDNPHDVGRLTISQFVGIVLFAIGLVLLLAIYKWLPERSPRLATDTANGQKV